MVVVETTRRRGMRGQTRARPRLRPPGCDSRVGIEIEDCLDRAAADDAERDVVAREHDAVRLRTEIAARLVVGALERAYLPRMRPLVQQRRVTLLLLAEERVHFRLRPVGCPDF